MLMHIITNFTANAGAEGMLSRLLQESQSSIVVPIINVSERYRNLSSSEVRFVPMQADTPMKALGVVPRIAELIRVEKPDAILCWMYHAMVLGTLAQRLSATRTPIYWNVRQSLDHPAALSKNTRMMLWTSRLISRWPDGVVFNSSRAAELHRRYGFRHRKTSVISNGFEPVAATPPRHDRPVVFGIAARFHPQKDYRTFFAAAGMVMRRHPNVRFIAAGSGLEMENPEVAALMRENELSPEAVTLCGELTDMDDFYRRIDVLVLSSLTEGFPNVVAEAMGHSRPVVTTDVGEAAAIVGETGLVVPSGSPKALAEAIVAMAEMTPSEYQARSRAARQRIVDRYMMSSVRRQFETVVGRI